MRAALILSLVPAMAAPAAANERRETFRVATVVVPGCTVTSEAGGSWGRIDLGTVAGIAGRSASGTLMSGGIAGIAVGCTPDTRASLVADLGQNGSAGQRRLARSGGPAAAVPYQLRIGSDAVAWDIQPIALAFPAGTTRQTLAVSATVTLPTALPAGTYTDTVRITLSF